MSGWLEDAGNLAGIISAFLAVAGIFYKLGRNKSSGAKNNTNDNIRISNPSASIGAEGHIGSQSRDVVRHKCLFNRYHLFSLLCIVSVSAFILSVWIQGIFQIVVWRSNIVRDFHPLPVSISFLIIISVMYSMDASPPSE